MKKKIKPIAIYLPQFHPIPENDSWWGKGFTEWFNVSRAKPRFKGHYQPQLPTELGFYDLRCNSIFHEQIALAKEAGIEAFMFYEYWFQGKQILEKPIDHYLQDISIEFPYFLCWANENWSRKWDGSDQEILLKQDYSIDDFKDHFNKVYKRHFTSSKYLTINGKPILAVYKPELIPNLMEMVAMWRSMTKEMGFEDLYIIFCSNKKTINSDFSNLFNASYYFQPDWQLVNSIKLKTPLLTRVVVRCLPKFINSIFFSREMAILNNTLVDYSEYVNNVIAENQVINAFQCVMPGWDNTSRRKNGNACIFINSNPNDYKRWLKHAVEQSRHENDGEKLLFINAWNEWAEGAHLEPCDRWGRSFIEATKNALK